MRAASDVDTAYFTARGIREVATSEFDGCRIQPYWAMHSSVDSPSSPSGPLTALTRVRPHAGHGHVDFRACAFAAPQLQFAPAALRSLTYALHAEMTQPADWRTA